MALPLFELRKLNNETTLKIKVHITSEIKIRIWIATKLLWLTSWILGCSFQFEDLTLKEFTDEEISKEYLERIVARLNEN